MESNPLRTSLAGLELQNPTILASGILGFSAESLNRVAKGGAGAVVSKSIGVEPRAGYPNPTIVQAEAGLINAMGLPNPGIDVYIDEIEYAKTILRIPLIVSVFGYSADEYASVAKKAVEAGADAVELNVSCPHVQFTGAEIGQNPRVLAEVVEKVKAAVSKPIIVKLTPNVADIAAQAKAAVEAGADALTAINTLKAMAIDPETMRPILSNIKGGLSGAAVKPVALRCVYDIREELPDVPIIGCGGVSDWRDAVEFFLAGASAVQVGTAVALEDTEVFQAITKGIETYLRRKHFGSVKEIVNFAHRS
ncbi:MAG TPA: dihydroorotate dehydrogenase [Candidatus Limnocylindrales bacterium]|nr:dihydroorotate dehydrogenase [Candidatus Limnocylindrales bacterium]